jgi:hypothetical protein
MAKSRSSSSNSRSGGRSGGRSGSSRSKSSGGGARKKSSGGKSSSRGGSRGGSGTRSRTARTSATASRSSGARSKSGGGSRGGGSGGRGGSAGSQTTTDHDQIRQWAEARGGKPACVRGTGGGDDIGMLRIDFPGFSGGDSLQEITWDEFFEKFDERGLALLYQETTKDGQPSNFNKLVDRNDAGRKSKSGRGK